jgi:hypothetical protein
MTFRHSIYESLPKKHNKAKTSIFPYSLKILLQHQATYFVCIAKKSFSLMLGFQRSSNIL